MLRSAGARAGGGPTDRAGPPPAERSAYAVSAWVLRLGAGAGLAAWILGSGTSLAHGEPAEVAGDDDSSVVALGNDAGFACSGVLIEARLVLTAAHCLPLTRVRIGENWDAAAASEIAVIGAEGHPDRRIDAALLTLAAAPEIAPAVIAPVARPTETVRIVGYGAQRRGRTLDAGGVRTRYTLTPGAIDCHGLRPSHAGCHPAFEWVVPSVDGIDTCRGDSGGGLFILDEHGPRLAAIVSRGVLHARRVCGDGGVYVRLSAILPWLSTRRTPRGEE